ncbi:MAG: glycosyltransferase family 2 protein [Candidatus Bathyarchaeota archaeon]|nr:MAG: glycosyltransferase family 2 protein [Candidatus Bathyarchaeota archaeon]
MHNKTPKISVIIPTLNEQDTIQQVLMSIPMSKMPPTEIIVVDSGSADRTVEFAEVLGVKVIAEHKRSYGNAILQGIRNAKADIVVVMDAGYQYNPHEIPRLIYPVMRGECEMVLGKRLAKATYPPLAPWRKVALALMSLLFNFLFESTIGDFTSGFRVMTKSIAMDILPRDMGKDPISFQVQSLAAASIRNFRIKEVPVTYVQRPVRDKIRTLTSIFRLFTLLIKGRLYLWK